MSDSLQTEESKRYTYKNWQISTTYDGGHHIDFTPSKQQVYITFDGDSATYPTMPTSEDMADLAFLILNLPTPTHLQEPGTTYPPSDTTDA